MRCSAPLCQAAREFSLTEIIRATADNPAVDMDAPRRTLDLLHQTGADHVVEFGLPNGAAVEAVTVEALEKAATTATDPKDRSTSPPSFAAIDGFSPCRLCARASFASRSFASR